MRHVVGVADMKISAQPGDVIVTHALGSCLGVAIHDPVVQVGGLFHPMLPNARVNPDKAAANPYLFVDIGTPLFFKEAYAAGARKERLVVKVAGGAAIGNGPNFFAIGRQNFTMLRKLFWRNGIVIAGEDVGGSTSRTMYLDISTGRTWIQTNGVACDL